MCMGTTVTTRFCPQEIGHTWVRDERLSVTVSFCYSVVGSGSPSISSPFCFVSVVTLNAVVYPLRKRLHPSVVLVKTTTTNEGKITGVLGFPVPFYRFTKNLFLSF